MSACLDADTAAAFAAGTLPPEQAQAAAAHIDGCADCRRLVSLLASSGGAAAPTHPSGEVTEPDRPRATLPRGTRIGPFEVLEPLGAGGMGVVYAAHDPRLDRRVALKAVRDAKTAPEQLLAEARAMARLTHPNVVQVHEVVEAYSQVFIAMELVVGESLAAWLEAAKRPWRPIVAMFVDVAQGLAAAHDAGLVHGDVKPLNVLVGSDGRARVTDFGLATLGPSRAGDVQGGTPGFMAPEQLAGRPCDARGDQYAFCVALHLALAGTLPGRETASPRTAFPRSIRAVLDRGLSQNPADRFPSMGAVAVALRAALSTRNQWLGAAAVLVAVSAAVSFFLGGRRGEAQACEAVATELEMPWNDASRAQLRHGFESTQLPHAAEQLRRVEAGLDAWKDAYEALRTRACTGPVEQLQGQVRCLTDRARDVRALLSELRDADATVVNNAVAATRRLAPVDLCPAVTKTPSIPADGPEVRALRDQLAKIRALREAGRPQAALTLAKGLPAEADRAGFPSFRAAARVALGGCLATVNQWDDALTELREGLYLAELAEDDRLRAQALVTMLQVGYKRGEHAQVVAMERQTLGAAQRVGDTWLATETMLMAGGSHSELGHPEKAQALFEEAVRQREKVYGKADRRSAFALSSLGNAFAMRGDLKGAIDAHGRAVVIGLADVGPAHPNIGVLYANLGDDHLYGLEPAAAVENLSKAVAVFEAAVPGGRELANGSTDLGFALLEAGDVNAALASFEKAEGLWAKLAPKHPVRAMALLGIHQSLEKLGRPSPIAPLEQAAAQSTGLPPFDQGRIRLALGLALPASEKARATELVKQALAGLSTAPLPLVLREKAKAEAWLQK